MALLALATFGIMLVVGYFYLKEGGIVTGLTGCFNVLLAGLISFHMWPYLANELEPLLQGTFLEHFEDAIALVVVFALTQALLRVAVSAIVKSEPQLPELVHRIGAGASGLLAGYFVAGFLLLVLQTLPWQRDFLGFQKAETPGFSERLLPSDQNFLKMMNRAHRGVFSTGEDQTKVFEEYEEVFATQRRSSDKEDQGPKLPGTEKKQPKAKPKEDKKPAAEKKDEPKKSEEKKDEEKKEEEKDKDKEPEKKD
jgi:hypothetical protein